MKIRRFVVERDKSRGLEQGGEQTGDERHTLFRVDEGYHQRGAIKMERHIQLVPTGESG